MEATQSRQDTPVESPLLKGIKWSLIGHFSLLAVVLFKGVFFPDQLISHVPTLKVDLVGLPDVLKKDVVTPKQQQLNQDISEALKKAEQDANRIKTTKPIPLPKEEAKQVAKTEPKAKHKEIAKKDEMVVKPSHQAHADAKSQAHPKSSDHSLGKKNKRALERLKALAKIQGFKEKAEPHHLIKGNQISPGSSLSGEAKEALEGSYYDTLKDQFLENWTLPPWLARQKDLTAQVQIQIDAKGNLKGLKFIKPSGNSQFDEAVQKVIHQSEPFPAPPEELRSYLLTVGILMGFPL
jgi:colicin import membrane protein